MYSVRRSVVSEFLEISSSDAVSATDVAKRLQRDLTVVQTSTFANEGLQQASSSPVSAWAGPWPGNDAVLR
jgi:hypothetical protein